MDQTGHPLVTGPGEQSPWATWEGQRSIYCMQGLREVKPVPVKVSPQPKVLGGERESQGVRFRAGTRALTRPRPPSVASSQVCDFGILFPHVESRDGGGTTAHSRCERPVGWAPLGGGAAGSGPHRRLT